MNKLSKSFTVLVVVLMCFFIVFGATAQDSDGKIRIKVQTNENGNLKTFEKTYDSREEMENDLEYKEFFGDQSGNVFFFKNGTGSLNFDYDVSWIDSLKNHLDMTNSSGNSFFFKSDSDTTRRFFRIDSAAKDSNIRFFWNENDEEHHFGFDLDKTMEELQKQFDKLNNDSDFDIFFFDENSEESTDRQKELMERLRDLRDRNKEAGEDLSSIVIIRKRVEIADLKDTDKELNKISNQKAGKLELDNFGYFPNPSDGRFSIRFSLEDEAPLDIRIYSISGKEIYRESYESFSGSFKTDIDVSRHDKGLYLLEIARGSKVLNKKLIIQ